MASTPYRVCDAFERGERARAGAFYSEGHALWSYGLLIATRSHKDGAIRMELPTLYHSPSQSTTRHLKACQFLQSASGEIIRRTAPNTFTVIHGGVDARPNDAQP